MIASPTGIRLRRLAAFLLVAGALSPPRAFGAGYAINEQGSKALGTAGAFTARADDPSAIFFNPAGLADQEGTKLNLGVHVIGISREFSGVPPYPGYGPIDEAENTVKPAINAYLTRRLSERWAAGLGVYNPFGLETSWKNPDDFSGRFINRKAGIVPFYITGIVAWKANGKLSLGGGPTFITSSISLDRNVGTNNPFYGDSRFPGAVQLLDLGTTDIDGSGNGWGWTAGVRWKPSDVVRFGAVFRSGVDIDYDSNADFSYDFQGSGNAILDNVLGPALAAQFPEDQGVAVSLPFPASFTLGFSFDPARQWTVEMDAAWTEWSRLDEVGLSFDDPSLDTKIAETWEDVVAIRAGVEFRSCEKWSWRGGAYFDPTPQPPASVDPLLPDADRVGLTLGAGFHSGSWTVDGYGLLLLTGDRSTNGESVRGFDGTYSSGAGAVGISLTHSFTGGGR